MVCHGYVAEVFKKLGVPLFDSIMGEYMQTCAELSDEMDYDSLFSCEICGCRKDVVIQVCPINANLKGLFKKKKGMMLFYVITVCKRHIGNDWFLYRHKGLKAFDEIEKKIVLSKFREYTRKETSGTRHDITNKKKPKGVITKPAFA